MPHSSVSTRTALSSASLTKPASRESDPFAALRCYVALVLKRRRTLSCAPWQDETHEHYARVFAAFGHAAWADLLFQDLLVLLGGLYRSPTSLFGPQAAAPYAAGRGLSVLFSCIGLNEPALLAFFPLQLAAFKACCLPLANDHQRSVVRYLASEIVKPSLDAGEPLFVRDPKYDQAIAHLFPELSSALSRAAPGAKECVRPHPSQPQQPSLPSWHAMDAPEDAFRRECINAAEAARVFDLRWSRSDDVDFDKWKRFEVVCQMPRSDSRFVRDAYDARRAGTDFPGFMLDCGVSDAGDAVYLTRLLASIFMLS